MTKDEFVNKYVGSFPDPHGRTSWKSWDDIRKSMKADLALIEHVGGQPVLIIPNHDQLDEKDIKELAKLIANKLHVPYAWEDIMGRINSGRPLPFKK